MEATGRPSETDDDAKTRWKADRRSIDGAGCAPNDPGLAGGLPQPEHEDSTHYRKTTPEKAPSHHRTIAGSAVLPTRQGRPIRRYLALAAVQTQAPDKPRP